MNYASIFRNPRNRMETASDSEKPAEANKPELNPACGRPHNRTPTGWIVEEQTMCQWHGQPAQPSLTALYTTTEPSDFS
jgi:hypothetical protein